MKRWYVVRSKHRNEVLLWHQLCSRGIEAYFPRISTKGMGCPPGPVRPLFPGYMFVHVDLDTNARSALQWMPGAIGFVTFGCEPAYVSDSILHGIEERVDQMNRLQVDPSSTLKPGDEIEIYSGPFAGYRGIFGTRLSDRDRATVFLKFIRDQQLRLELPVTQIRLTKQCRTRL
jgi:transcription antitermination factor NusG